MFNHDNRYFQKTLLLVVILPSLALVLVHKVNDTILTCALHLQFVLIVLASFSILCNYINSRSYLYILRFSELFLISGIIINNFSFLVEDTNRKTINICSASLFSLSFFVLLALVHHWFSNFEVDINKRCLNWASDRFCGGLGLSAALSLMFGVVCLSLINCVGGFAKESDFLVALLYIFAIFATLNLMMEGRQSRFESFTAKLLLESKAMLLQTQSHEIRTPLNTVILGLDLIHAELKRLGSIVGMEMMEDVQLSVTIALDLVNDSLTFGKLDQGILVLNPTAISLWTVVLNSVKPFSIQAGQGNVALQISAGDVPDITTLYLYGDKNKVAQVIRNLLSNALKFTPPGGMVSVTAELIALDEWNGRMLSVKKNKTKKLVNNADKDKDDGLRLRISVKDTGAGISQENQKRLFREVIQFHAAKLQKGKGSGLGLWITKGIVDMHHGTISVSSEGEGSGTTFVVEFPVYRIQGSHEDSDVFSVSPSVSQNDSITDRQHGTLRNFILPRNDSSSSLSAQLEEEKRDKRSSPPKYSHYETCSAKSILPYFEIQSPTSTIAFPTGDWLPSPRVGVGVDDSEDESSCMRTKRISPQPQQQQPTTSPERGLLRVLVVDDAVMSRKMVCRVLEGRCAHVCQAGDGIEAVDLVTIHEEKGTAFDVVLLDYEMPRLDGPGAARRMRSAGFTGKIIGVTGNTLQSHVDVFIAHGADRVLSKPLDMVSVCKIFWED